MDTARRGSYARSGFLLLSLRARTAALSPAPQPTHRFDLQTHAGPYQRWPGRSRLIVDGQPHRTAVPGYVLLRQFALPEGYLLITDFDCPFEEATSFVLLDEHLRVVSHRTLSGMYTSYLLKRVQWRNDRELVAFFVDRGAWRVSIRAWSLPYLRPRLALQREHDLPLQP